MQISIRHFERLFLLLTFSFFGWSLSAQDLFFNQYHFSPLATNPGQAGTLQDAWVGINYRSVPLHLGEKFITSQASALYPVGIGNHRLVFSGSFFSDRVTEFFNTTGGSLGAALSISLSERSELSFGTQAVVFGNSVTGDISTDSQFINGIFDPTAPTGELIGSKSRQVISASSGLYWQVRNHDRRVKGFAGISLFNFTNPEMSYSDQISQKLPTTYKATLGYEILKHGKFAIVPNAQGIIGNGKKLLQAGSLFTYDVAGNGAKQIGLGGWYSTNELAVFSVQYQQPEVKAALSFDVPVSNAYGGAVGSPLEIAIFYRIFKKSKREATPMVVQTAVPVAAAQPISADDPTEVTAEPDSKTEVEEQPVKRAEQPVQEELASAPLTPEEERIIDENVRFKLDSDILDESSQEYLAQVVAIFQRHANLHIQLTGHTCNTGSQDVNQTLSIKRAESVKAYLINKGVGEDRITVDGKGETQPLTDNSSEALRQLNRRVEIKIAEESK
jgi:type IX secretion system PorP/SprF family membrane protein